MERHTATPFKLLNGPQKEALVAEFSGKAFYDLRTPAFVIDRTIFAENCGLMHQRARNLGAQFRAHLKTHKTTEGTRLQLVSNVDRTHAVVVSTLMEAWEVVRAGLVADGTVKDILYGLPVAPNKVADLASLRQALAEYGGVVRLLIDHPDQVRFLEKFEDAQVDRKIWSTFVKIDGGQRRAGVFVGSPMFDELLSVAFNSPSISVYGFYQHAGNSYASKSQSDATAYLLGEVDAVNLAAKAGLAALRGSKFLNAHQQPFVLSVGSTPTAHSVTDETRKLLAEALNGTLELHAGNYPMLDLQQRSTGMVKEINIAQRVLATVVSYYPGRGKEGQDEALVDAGAIAFSKDTGPSGTFGEVLNAPWNLVRISQEHGILSYTGSPGDKPEPLELGSVVEIVGQHACLIAAAYPWYYVVDKDIEGGRKVVDVWVPWKGW